MKGLLAAVSIALALSVVAQGRASSDSQKPTQEIRPLDQPVARPERPETEEDRILAGALSRAIDSGWQSLHLVTRCPSSRQTDSLEVFGTGVAVWNSSRQFEMPAATIRQVLAVLKDAGFASMPAAFGGETEPVEEAPEVPRPGAEVTCQISVELDGHEKTVVQLREGDQSRRLADLATAVLDLARSHARQGVSPTGLQDALARLATGELAPQLLGLSVHLKTLDGDPGGGWMLAIRGQHAEARSFAAGAGYGEARRVLLDAEEIRTLARRLVRGGVAALPANLWAQTYTDLDVSVMRWRKSIQARQFDGMEPGDLGDQQKAFDALIEGVRELNLRIMKPGPTPP